MPPSTPMNPFKHYAARMAVAYRQATRNEYALDAYWQERDEWARSFPIVLPRIHKLRKYLVLPAPATVFCARIAVVAWMYGFFPLLILGQFMALALRILAQPEAQRYRDMPHPARLVFAGTSIINRSLERLPTGTTLPDIALITPKSGVQQVAARTVHGFRVANILDLKDTLRALRLSWFIAQPVFRERARRPGIPLQTYTCFEWTVVLIALLKMAPDEVWMTNLYDRWAVLVDFYIQGVLRGTPWQRGTAGRKTSRVLQHGIEFSDFPRLYKLRSIRELWYFHRPSADIFLTLAAHRPGSVQLEKYPGTLHVVEGEQVAGRYAVLLILHPMVSDRMHALIRGLQEIDGVYLFAKAHPLHPQEDFKSYSGSHIYHIEDKKYFPRVDCAVTYKSALAVEYEEIGTDVLYVENLTDEQILERITLQLSARQSLVSTSFTSS